MTTNSNTNRRRGARLLIAAMPAIFIAGALPACDSSPRLKQREALNEANEAITRIARQREEARALAGQAERVSEEDPARAIELYQQSHRLDDSQQLAWNNLGTLLLDRGNYADAVNAFGRASQLVPGDPRPEYNIGIAYQRNGWGEDAFRHFGNAIERDPSHMPSMRGYIRAAEMTGRADNTLLAMIKNATMRETDPEWRDYLMRQRYRVEAVLNEE